MTTLLSLTAVAFVLGAPVCAQSARPAGSFDVGITKSPVLTPGKYHLDTRTATVTLTNEFLRGRVNAFKVEMRADKTRSATFVLLLDDRNRITQADLTIIVPGRTIARTIAWTAEDLDKNFSDYHYENGRLRLRSKGSYATGSESPNEILTMSWDVDFDLPVIRRPTAPP